MFKIKKSFMFSASHTLHHLPEEHPCSRLHGHNYEVILELGAPTVDDVGMVLDYRKLEEFKSWLNDTFDHRDLNEVCPFNPTAELLAKYIYDCSLTFIPAGVSVLSVTVKETPKTEARYEPR